jgi:hypothetical protein
MSLNFDVNSNLSLVRRFHTMEKLQKCINFILKVPVFFATNCKPPNILVPSLLHLVLFFIFFACAKWLGSEIKSQLEYLKTR